MEQQHLEHPVPSRIPTVATSGAPAHVAIHDEINAATRRQHTTLNRLIIQQLPLALPTVATGPAVYGQGITVFAQIYFVFEQTWQEIIESPVPEQTNVVSREIELRRCLAELRPPGLARTERLRNDLQYLSQRTGTHLDVGSRAQERMFRRMRQSLREKPHALVAYAWVMYMALFSGGRWIRQMLQRAGPNFWLGLDDNASNTESGARKHQSLSTESPGFSFLSFDDGRDGQDIKTDFKSRLADLETLLSARERKDIVVAAAALFDDCITLVGVLDHQTQVQCVRRKRTLQLLDLVTGLLSIAGGSLSIMAFFGWANISSSFPYVRWLGR